MTTIYLGIMPHAETDLAIPWAVVCILLLITGLYGVWACTKVKGPLSFHVPLFSLLVPLVCDPQGLFIFPALTLLFGHL